MLDIVGVYGELILPVSGSLSFALCQ
jgi:hypothetical protein